MQGSLKEATGVDELRAELHSSIADQGSGIKRWIFFFTTVFCLAIPGLAAVKAIAIVLTWIYVIAASKWRFGGMVWALSILLSLAVCGEVALFQGVPLADFENHLSRFGLFFLVIGIGASLAGSRAFKRGQADWILLAAALISGLLKVLILVAIAQGLITFDSLQVRFGFESVTDAIAFGIQRLQFPSDISLIFLLACYTGRRKVMDILFLLSVTVSIFLSFSRYLFIAYGVCLVIRYFRTRRLDLISSAALVLVLVLAGLFSESLVSRFSGTGAKESDSTRTEQIRYLSGAIGEHPLMGSGIGSSVNGYKRSETIPFSYEVQWFAMTMQLGIVGMAWFTVNLIWPLAKNAASWRGRWVYFTLLALWVMGGLTNPFVLSLGSAFGFAILMIVVTADESNLLPHSRATQLRTQTL